MWVEKWERSVHHCHHGSPHLNPFLYVIDMKVYYKNHPHLYKLSSIYEEIWPVLLKICQFQSSKIIFDAPELMLVGLKLGNMCGFFNPNLPGLPLVSILLFSWWIEMENGYISKNLHSGVHQHSGVRGGYGGK